MSSHRHRRRREASVDEHGIDPATFFQPRHDARGERKVQQLCREVERTLSYALGGCSDERIRELIVMSVEPALDGSRLLVTVCPSGSTLNLEVGSLMDAIEGVRGFLRAEVAAAIQRKRTPELTFRVAPPIDPEGSP